VSRRTATLVVSGLLLGGLVAVAALLPVPYVVFRPGPLTDVLGQGEDGPIITAEGVPTYPTDGVLNLTTVGVTPAGARMDLLTAVQGWFDPERAVVPRDVVYPGNPSTEEARQVNAVEFASSQDVASVAALRYLGFEVPTESNRVLVREVLPDGAAEGVLEPGDVILTVDGEPVSAPQAVVDAVSSTQPGQPVPMRVERDDETVELDVPTKPSQDDPDRAAIGVIVGPTWDLPVEVSIDVPGEIGGPSAGLVFTLGIIDTLTPENLVAGADVAGTGEISSDGTVGPISGVQQKIAAARDGGGELFLVPRANCGAADGANPGDMLLVPVETVDDAVDAIEALRSGDAGTLPTCAEVGAV
jgi:PDZ domain-containing protein